jgi:SAM-dependent MidA family methyltransferase
VGEPAERLRALIARGGPVSWSTVVDAALYGPGGFYTTGGGAGRDRDYLTSPELGPLFGAVVARAIDECWDRCGQPDPWIVVEAGAGGGALAATVLAAPPRCAPALRYVAVEPSPALRAAAAGQLRVEEPAQVLGPLVAGETLEPRPLPGLGPLVTVMSEPPVGPFTGMVLAHELLDNLAFDVYQRAATTWAEVRVSHDGSGWTEVSVPAAVAVSAHLESLAPDAPAGARVPWQGAARRWIRTAAASIDRGMVVAFDYTRTTAEMASWGGWMRTYRAGGRGTDPLEDLGLQDITTDVAVDQLQGVVPSMRTESQAAWLERHGMDELVAAAREEWIQRAVAPDLRALQARSRVGEAAALSDVEGLGSFAVMELGPLD